MPELAVMQHTIFKIWAIWRVVKYDNNYKTQKTDS